MTVKEKDARYIAGTYARFPVTLVRGSGAELFDDGGRRYIDMGSGIGVNIFGAADPEWTAAVSAQLSTLAHASNLYFTEPCVRVAEKLALKSGMKKVFFAGSGAEANECAIKTARKWAAERKGADHFTVVTLEGGFHGRTLAALAATGQEGLHRDFLPLTPGFVYAPAGDAEALERAVSENKCAAIMIETVQGEGGVLPLGGEFIRAAEDIARRHDILFIVDEVQTGIGRTGKFYSYMHYGVTPDIVTSAKGLGGGLPIGAALFGERTESVLTPGSHGSTFGGNPAVCAGAEVVLDRLTGEFLAEVTRKGERLAAVLRGAAGIRQVTGLGLMLGAETVRPVADILSELRAEGVLALKAHDRLRLLPPLNIPDSLLDEAAEKIAKVCAK